MKTKLSLPRAGSRVTTEDGLMTVEWYTFFQGLYNRVGGNDSQSDQITDADGSLADATRAINEIIDALENYGITPV